MFKKIITALAVIIVSYLIFVFYFYNFTPEGKFAGVFLDMFQVAKVNMAKGSEITDKQIEKLERIANEDPGGIWADDALYLITVFDAVGPISKQIKDLELLVQRYPTIHIEPWRSAAFPVIKDLVVDRSSFDRIQHAGGFISVNTSGNTIDANTIPINKKDADDAFDAATCIGCGACVATCKNSSAMLFVAAKVSQYALLPQGRIEATDRVLNMVNQMDAEGFGNCTNTGACEVECPKGISLENIARMNREYLSASLK